MQGGTHSPGSTRLVLGGPGAPISQRWGQGLEGGVSLFLPLNTTQGSFAEVPSLSPVDVWQSQQSLQIRPRMEGTPGHCLPWRDRECLSQESHPKKMLQGLEPLCSGDRRAELGVLSPEKAPRRPVST